MPELPEVETIKRQLSTKLIGLTIKKIEVLKPKMFSGNKEEVIGKKIALISRRAKILIMEVGELYLVFHLKMTGQLVYVNKDGKTVTLGHPIPFAGMSLPAKTTHIIFSFNNGGRLFFNDLRQFGWVKVVKDLREMREIGEFGPEPFGPEFTVNYLRKIMLNWGRPIKLLLMEQSKIAGIGNIYANDALFLAGVNPLKRARDLVKKEPEKVEKLHKAIITVLKKGIEAGGSSAADEAYVNAKGEKGEYKFLVYQKDGNDCSNKCGGKIKRMNLGGRGTFFCPACQR